MNSDEIAEISIDKHKSKSRAGKNWDGDKCR